MTDEQPSVMPALDVRQNGAQPTFSVSLDAIMTLIHSFGTMVSAMERRIADRMAENAEASKERWGKWEERLGKVERQVADHLREEHEDEIRTEARVRPVRLSLAYVGRHWRTAALLILSALALAGYGVETLRTILG
jgi:hypothetical protein